MMQNYVGLSIPAIPKNSDFLAPISENGCRIFACVFILCKMFQICVKLVGFFLRKSVIIY